MATNEIISLFSTDEVLSLEPHGCGHINSTYAAKMKKPSGEEYELLFQKINNYVFPTSRAL